MLKNPTVVTRRKVLLMAGAGITVWAAAGPEFWDKKPPSEWTTEEIDRLITKSPWAKEVTADYVPRQTGGGPGPWGEGVPGGGGIGLGGRRHRPVAAGGAASSYKGIVRWESAKPILEAMKTPLPEQFANHYVISVNGIPLLGDRRDTSGEAPTRRPTEDDPDDNLKQLTSLQPKGKDLAQAGVVHRQVGTGNSFLFGFSSKLVPLSLSDGEAVFTTRLGQLTVKAKFNFKEMLYHGQLAL